MKRSFLILISVIFITMLFTPGQGIGAEQKSEPNKIQGTIKEKLEKPDRIVLAPPYDNSEFLYANDNNEGCVPWKDLKVGDNVELIYKEKKKSEEKKARLDAICVQYIPAGTTLKGVTLKGVSVH